MILDRAEQREMQALDQHKKTLNYHKREMQRIDTEMSAEGNTLSDCHMTSLASRNKKSKILCITENSPTKPQEKLIR